VQSQRENQNTKQTTKTNKQTQENKKKKEQKHLTANQNLRFKWKQELLHSTKSQFFFFHASTKRRKLPRFVLCFTVRFTVRFTAFHSAVRVSLHSQRCAHFTFCLL